MSAPIVHVEAAGERHHRHFILGITVVVTLGGLLFGYDTGVIGGSQLYFTEYFGFSPTQQGFAVSSALLGCPLGAAIAASLSDRLGRKQALIASAVLFTVSAWGSGIPETLGELALYRAIGGVGLGIASMVAPMYIAEIAPAAERGRLVSYYQLAIVVGFFVVFLATYLIGGGDTRGLSGEQIDALHRYNVERGWRVMLWSELLPSAAFLVLLFFVPETPRWLTLRGCSDEARRLLGRISASEQEADRAFTEIVESLRTDARQAVAHPVLTLMRPRLRRMLAIGVCLSICQQVTGINAILYYGAEIFSNALGYGPEDALKQQLLLGGVNLIFTFVAIHRVDHWGRRPLLVAGLVGMGTGIATLGLSIYFQQLGLVALLGMLTFVASFALSMGPVTWVVLSEIFPNRLRSTAMSIAVAAQWLFNALVAQTFPMLNGSALNATAFRGSLPYIVFALLCMATVAFVWALIPETKGRSLEQMDDLWHARA